MAPNGYYSSARFTQRIHRTFGKAEGLANENVRCLLLCADGSLLAGTEKGLFRLTEEQFVPVFKDVLNGEIRSLYAKKDGSVAVLTGSSVYFLINDTLKLYRTFEEPVVEYCEARGYRWVLTENRIFRILPAEDKVTLCRFLEGGKGKCMVVNDTDIYIATEGNISALHGKRNEWKNILPAFSSMPKEAVTSMHFDGAGHLWVGTVGGAALHDNAGLWLTHETLRQLPENAIYKIKTDAVGGVWFASDVGVLYLRNGKMKYFSAERWVPDNNVNDLAVSRDGETVFAATAKGISEISACEMSLADKADHFEDTIENYHIRLGFTANREDIENYDISTGRVHISDNDGLWTACYVAAESYRYAVTCDPEALRKARRGMNALLFLTRITGIPGFTARAVRYPGEPGFGNGDPEWALAADGSCEWKGETSSDEMTGHFFGFSTYYDFCANDAEKKEIRIALCAIMDHILDNNYHLIDYDGKPTTWAVWDPALLNHDDKWVFERGINSLELLTFLKVSYHVSGSEKYSKLYSDFVRRHHYALNASHHKIRDAHICHIDDNLAFLASLTLLRLETDPALRALYLCGMEDHWQYERTERQPLFCMIHAAFTGRDSDLVEGVQSLREYPLDLVFYAMENSKRRDLVYDTEQAEWHEPPQVLNVLPYDERNIRRPDTSAFELDCEDRHYAEEGTSFLLPYWIGRYFGLLREAEQE